MRAKKFSSFQKSSVRDGLIGFGDPMKANNWNDQQPNFGQKYLFYRKYGDVNYSRRLKLAPCIEWHMEFDAHNNG